MTPERHRQIGDLYHEALQIAADRRSDFLRRACGDNVELLGEVESLLAYQDQAQSFIESPAWEVAAVALAEESSNAGQVRPGESPPDPAALPPHHDRRGIRIRIDRPGKKSNRNPQQLAAHRSSLPLPRQSRRGRYYLILVAVVAPCIIAGAIALIKWRDSFSLGPLRAPSAAGPNVILERSLSYTVVVRRDPQRDPDGKPFLASGAIDLRQGDLVRFQISSPQDGFLYLFNEGPKKTHGRPQFNILFPNAPAGGDPTGIGIRADVARQIPPPSNQPELDWFLLDSQRGIEKVWFIWAAGRVPELEAARIWANPQDKGEIGDPQQIEAIARYLARYSDAGFEPVADEASHRTTFKGKGEVLVGLLRLAHR